MSAQSISKKTMKFAIKNHFFKKNISVQKKLYVIVFISFLFLASCKTCKCPAYSQNAEMEQPAQNRS